MRSSGSVSVVIPSFNRRRTLARAVESCLRQSFPPREIIVVDDGSTDGTETLVRGYAGRDSKVRYLRFPENRGGHYARIEGIQAARSEWIAFLDSDDELTADSLERRLVAAAQSPFEPGLVYGDAYREKETEERLVRFERLSGHVYPRLLRKKALCVFGAVMVRRACFETVGYPLLDMPSHQDADTICRIARVFSILHCGAAVAVVHKEEERVSASPQRAAEGRRRFLSEYRDDIWKHHGLWGLFFWRLSSAYFRHGGPGPLKAAVRRLLGLYFT